MSDDKKKPDSAQRGGKKGTTKMSEIDSWPEVSEGNSFVVTGMSAGDLLKEYHKSQAKNGSQKKK